MNENKNEDEDECKNDTGLLDSTATSTSAATTQQSTKSINNTNNHIALFGLSADPPTGRSGHAGLIEYLIKTNVYSEIIILPVYNHAYDSKKGLQSYEHRLQMCKLNFECYSTPECPVIISELEKELTHDHNYNPSLGVESKLGTYDIVSYYLSMYPDKVVHLVLGADTFNDLIRGRWKESDK